MLYTVFILFDERYVSWAGRRGELDVTSNQISDAVVWKLPWKMEFIILLEGGTSLARKPLPSHYLSLPATLCSLHRSLRLAFESFQCP